LSGVSNVKPPRRLYLDWLRGVAVLVMILWHSVDSWHVRTDRDTLAFGTVQFLAGWAAPLFLFLAGVSMPMAGMARMTRGVDRLAASRELIRRGWQVFLIAHLFRLQSFLMNPNASWNGLLKPDILNVLGLGLVAAAFGWGRAATTRARVWWLLVPAVIVAVVLTPWARLWWWPTLLHPRLEAYIRPVGNQGVFSLFPAVGYLFAGAFAGATLAEWRKRSEAEFLGLAARWGFALLAAGVVLDAVRLAPPIEQWTGPLAVVSWRVGAMLLMLAGAWRYLRDRSLSGGNPLMVFGRTSLFVYWVHVELAYGSLSYPLRASLDLPEALLAYVLFTGAMYGLAVVWLRRPKGPVVPARLRSAPVAGALTHARNPNK
jgi:uncharacterized membrane protein